MINTLWIVRQTKEIIQLQIFERRFIYSAYDDQDRRIKVSQFMGKPLIPQSVNLRKYSASNWFIYLNISNRAAIAPMKESWGKVLADEPEMCQTPIRLEDLTSFLELTS